MAADARAVSVDAVEFYDAGFGFHILPVTPPDGPISPYSTLVPKAMGKAPGRLTGSGWTGIDLNHSRERCHDYKTAVLWGPTGWGANVGFVSGDGYVFIDNDQGAEFSGALQEVFRQAGIEPLRRYVLHPKHKRDAFLLRVLNFVGDSGAANHTYSFRKGTTKFDVQVRAHSLQTVVAGTHPGTKCPYVWNRKIEKLDDIPVLSDVKFDECIRKFMEALRDGGWTVPQAPGSGTTGTSSSGSTSSSSRSAPDPATIKSRLAHVGDLLVLTPNRVVPAEKATKADLYLDDYQNWVDFTYMIAAAMGWDVARTPEAEAFFVNWSNGRPQAKQPSHVLWRSVVNQPNWQFGDTALEKKVRELVPPNPPFPDDGAGKSFTTLDEINAEWAYLVKGNGWFVNLKDGTAITANAFSGYYANRAEDMSLDMRAKGWKPRRKRQVLTAAQLFNEQPVKQVLSDLTYWPGAPEFVVNLRNPTNPIYNRWKAPKLEKPIGPFNVKPWLDHVELIAGAERDPLLGWLAFVVQCPDEAPNWHPLIMTQQGLGKNMMVEEPLKVALGADNCRSTDLNGVTGEFNTACETKLLIISEAHQATRHDRAEAAGRLKSILTRPPDTLWINPKGLPKFEMRNRIAMILFSNDSNPVAIEQGDRRFCVMDRRHLPVQPPGYYASLQEWLDKGGRDEVAGYLHAYPLTDMDKRQFRGPAPGSPDKEALVQQNKDPVLVVLEDLIQDARDGMGPFNAGLATEEELADHIGQRLHRPVGGPQIRPYLHDMERQGKGVGRVRVDPKHPNQCGIVQAHGYDMKRLWYLIGQAPGGRNWRDVPASEVLAIRLGRSKVTDMKGAKRKADFPDDEPI